LTPKAFGEIKSQFLALWHVYVTLHVGGKEFLHRHSLASMLLKLDPRRFVRVHRSAVVNIESIVQLQPLSHGEFEATTKHGADFA
jgi:two-component system LytT family response regulator